MIFTPYGDVDFATPDLAPSLFHGVISFLDKTEPYMPDRVARQFGRVQQIPKPVIDPIRAWRRSKVTSYVVEYDSAKWSWDAWPMHRFNPKQLGPRSRHGVETDSQYMAWYIPRTHPRITSPHTEAIQVMYHKTRNIVIYIDGS